MKMFTGTCLALLISLSAMPTYAKDKPHDGERHHPTASSVPEINVSNVGIVIALMAGAVAILRETRKQI